MSPEPPERTGRFGASDRCWFRLVAACWVAELALTWRRWGNPLVDCGREMNLPLRLARGEMLYSQAKFLYGPFSPYFHAALYRIFGASLNVLYADGIVTATLILVLVYGLARVWTSASAAAMASLLLIGLCAMKPAGNYIVPYSYSALHGSAAALLTLALAVRYAQTRRAGWLFAAGVCAAVALTAKLEFGAAALGTGIASALLTEFPDEGGMLRGLGAFLVPAAGISGAVYGAVIRAVGWHVLNRENHVFFGNVPPELMFFNRWISGMDKPAQNALFMISLLVELLALSYLVAWAAARAHRWWNWRVPSWRAELAASWRGAAIAAGCIAAAVGLGLVFSKEQLGPFVAMPLLLAGLIVLLLTRYLAEVHAGKARGSANLTLLIAALFSLAMLARLILRVRSGGAYASYLLPGAMVMFVYLWGEALPNWFAEREARRLAHFLSLGLLGIAAAATMVVVTYRYRTELRYRLATPRGTMIMSPNYGAGFEQAMRLIGERTAPGDAVAVMPEGTSLDFFTGRRNPLRDEILTPGYLDAAGEQEAIGQLRDSQAKLVLITNRPTSEFGPKVFGEDYDRTLMAWIEANYAPCGVLGRDTRPPLPIGDARFFIRAYCRR